jgi:serine/threonine protein kinase
MLHRDVAVKEVVLPPDLTQPERDDLNERTLREARAAGRLSHPNVVAVYDVVQAEGRPWIVMELVRSRSLYQTIREDGPISPRRAAEVGLAVLAALRAAHQAGVWHRDVKPGNVLLATDGRVVLTDFGLATYDGDGGATRSGLILGSAQYISPERARDGASGPEADLWSLGATLYAAVEGRSPYARDSSMATLTALATQPPDPPRRAGPLRPVLIGLLRKNPRHRMRAAEAERLLRRVAAGEAVPSRRLGLLSGRARAAPEAATAPVAGADPAPATIALRAAPPHPSPPGSRPDSSGPDVSPPVPARPGSFGPGSFGPGSDRPDSSGPGSAWPGSWRSVAGQVVTAGRPYGGTSPGATTEDTHRYATRRPWWLWAAALLVVAVALPLAVLGVDSLLTGGPTKRASGLPSSATAPVITAAMGVQACAGQSPQEESPIPDGGAARAGEYAPLPGWTYYRDRAAGFRLAVPSTWRMSTVGALTCFRDPSSPKAIAVADLGRAAGDPMDLLADGEPGWRAAAGLIDYQRLALTDAHYDEGAADLEYTYLSEQTRLHGVNRLLRLGGRVFILSWLTTEFTWTADQALVNFLQPSFGLG